MYNTLDINYFTVAAILFGVSHLLFVACYLSELGFYTLFLLLFLNVQSIIEYVQLHFGCIALRKHKIYYINNNTDQVHEPNFVVDVVCDTAFHLLKICYDSFLISNISFSYQLILHLWMFYILTDLQHSLSKLKHTFYALRAHYKIHHTLTKIIPKEQEMCAICHDELLVARALPCAHVFHFKCIYNWLKSQPSCPICRQQVTANLFHQNNSIISQLLNFFSNITLLNITIYFSRDE